MNDTKPCPNCGVETPKDWVFRAGYEPDNNRCIPPKLGRGQYCDHFPPAEEGVATIAILPISKPPNSDAVEKLEALLAQVKSGDVESFIAAAFRPNKRWFVTFSGQINTLEKIGALDCMKADLRQSMDER